MALITYRDAIQHVLDFLGAQAKDIEKRDARRAVQLAYRALANQHRWSYYYSIYRLHASASYSTGTIQYTHSTREVTLTSGTWPSWARLGVLVVAGEAYEVESRDSDTVLTLEANSNPGANVASGTSYAIYRDTYPFPSDFQAVSTVRMDDGASLTYITPTSWLARRNSCLSFGTPTLFTIMGDPNYMNALALRLHPIPSTSEAIDFLYQRRPRELVIEEYNTGTIACTSGGYTATVTGGTFTSSMVGSVIRLSSNSTSLPTDMFGANQPAQERVITDVPTSTTATVDQSFTQTLSGVKYTISDPVDIEDGAMLEAFLRGMEFQVSVSRSIKGYDQRKLAYNEALTRAKEADSRSFATRSAMPWRMVGPLAMASIPVAEDIE